ncbi:MAG TPA: 3-oxoacyl-[acyl-carrier-protein] synthase III C-terminal domain-containing protein, partial [Mycobacterium sp.]|nr:3-oxoacyl-[acyl-carrier-protein] synthase III C-terminal domain-containing protein [Mycobacterium sp.]
AAAAARAVDECLRASALRLDEIDAIVAAPATSAYRAALADLLRVPVAQITVAADAGIHTASLAAAFDRAAGRTKQAGLILLVAAGAGITAGAALYRLPPTHG